MDMQFYAGASLALFLAYSVKSSTGLGSALIAVPLLGLIMNFKDAVAFDMLFEAAAGILLISHCFKFVNWPVFLILSIGSFIGVPLGTEALKKFSVEFIGITIGVVAAGFGIMMLAVDTTCYKIPVKNKIAGLAAGFVGGVFKGMCGMGGPPVTAYCNYVFEDKATIRATLIAVFAVSSFQRLALYLKVGLVPEHLYLPFFALLPVFLIATFFGPKIFAIFNENTFRKTVAIIIVATGLLSIYKGLIK